MNKGKFVFRKSTDGKWYFILQASNGRVIATSETYNSKQAAMNGIRLVKVHTETAVIDDKT